MKPRQDHSTSESLPSDGRISGLEKLRDGEKLRYIRLTKKREHNLRVWLVEHGIPPTPEVLASFTQNSSKTAQSAESRSTSRKPRPLDPEVARRRALVRSNANVSADEMVEIFDREGMSLPTKWREAGFNTWSEARGDRNYRGRIDTLISKDRRKN